MPISFQIGLTNQLNVLHIMPTVLEDDELGFAQAYNNGVQPLVDALPKVQDPAVQTRKFTAESISMQATPHGGWLELPAL